MYDFGPSSASTEDLLFEAYGFDPFIIETSDYVWMYDPKTGVYYTDEPLPTKTRDLLTVMSSHPVQARLKDWAENVVGPFIKRQVDPQSLLKIGYVVPRYFHKKKKDLVVDHGNTFTISFQIPFSLKKNIKKTIQAAWIKGDEEPHKEMLKYLMAAFGRMFDIGLYNNITLGSGTRGMEQSAQQIMSGQQTVINALMDLDIPKKVLKEKNWKKVKGRLMPSDFRRIQ